MNSKTFKDELDCLFWTRKDKIKNVLEIGTTPDYKTIGEYHIYFNNATLFSIDNYKGESCFGEQQYIKANPFSLDIICKLCKVKFDFIVAEGEQLNSVQDQIFVAQNYYKLLNDNGILIIKNIKDIDDCKKILSNALKYYYFEIKELDCIFIIMYKYKDICIIDQNED